MKPYLLFNSVGIGHLVGDYNAIHEQCHREGSQADAGDKWNATPIDRLHGLLEYLRREGATWGFGNNGIYGVLEATVGGHTIQFWGLCSEGPLSLDEDSLKKAQKCKFAARNN